MTIRFRAVDNAGNISEESTTVVNLDKTGPVISSITNSSNGQWTKDPVKLTWTITENGSGIEKVEYGYDGKTWQGNLGTAEWNGLTRSNERNDVLYIRATDKAGNVSNIQSSAMKIDTTLPTVGIGTNGGTYKITAGNTTVNISTTLTAGDEGGSGLKNIQYQISNSSTIPADNDANWKNFTSGASITEAKTGGTWYLYTKVTDNAGNRATTIQKSNAYVVNYQILYNANGGNGEPGEQTKTHGQDLTLSATKPTREGYTFLGWSEDSKATSATYSSGGLYKNNKAVTLYAVWSKGEYSLTVNPNGGTWNNTTEPSVITQAYGSTKTIENPTAPAGYKVTYNGNGGSTPSEQTSTKTFTNWTHTGEGTLSGTTYTFGAGAGTLTANYKNNAITLPTPTRTGYTFAGWYDAATGGNKVGNGGASYTPTKAITLYAHWTVNSYTLTVNPNGGTWEGSTGSQQFTQTYGSTKTISNPTAPAGYKVTYNGNGGSTPNAQTSTKSFTGWTTSGAGTLSGTTYTFGAGAGTLTANYKNNAITLPTPTRTGYTFDGWYDAATGGNKVGDGGASYIPTKAITLYAHWTINQYKIDLNFNVDGTPYYSGYNGRIYVRLKIDGEDKGFVQDYGGNYDYGTKWEITALKLDGVEIPYTMSGTLGDSNYSLMVYFYTITIGVNNSNYGKVSASTLLVPNNNTKYTTSGTTLTLSDGREVTATVTESTGYTTTFSSWSPATATITAATNVTANFTRTANSYTATFDANGGGTVTPSSITKKYGEALGTLPTVSRTGYTFNGWFTATSGGQKISTSTTMPATNVTYYAQWSINSYTLTVNPNGGTWEGSTGSQQFTQTYGSTKTISNPTAPAGYKVTYNGNGGSTPSAQTSTKSFTGWTTSGAGTLSGTTYTFGAGAGTLTANYKNNAITLQTPTRTGYTFAGWYDAATGGNKVGNGGASYTPTKAITLYAHWTANTYTVAFNGNGNTGGSTASVSMTYDTAKNLTANGYTKTGYTFKSWNTKPDGSGTTYANSASVKNLTSTNGGTVTLYAQWTANTYTIAFNGNGNTGGSTASVSMTYDTAKNLTANGFTKTGYTFKSWNTKSDGTGTTYANSASVKNLTSTNGGTVTLYAQWTKKQVVVTFMRNTSSTDTTSATQTFTYGTAGQSFSNKNWTRTGYSLLGWSEDKNATTQQYSTLSGVSDSWIDSKSPKVTLYAVWKTNSYTATFNSNGGGTPSPSTITKTYGTQLGTLPTVSRTGYTFKGWFTQSTGGEKISTTTTMPANNVTYYAQWTANTYTIEYNANGGTGSTVSSSHTYGVSKALTKNGFTKTGYTFLGWSKDKTATSATYTDEQSVVNISSTNGEKVILYAIWKINSYTVTYNYSANGGTSATKTTATFNYGEAVDLTPVATKSEYTFVGWNTEQTATSKLNSLNMGTNNITLYAIYSKTITATFKYYNNQSESINKTIYNRETTATLTTKGAIGTPSRTYF